MAGGEFRGARLQIAQALNGRRRTLYETAKAIGRRPGDIQRSVRQMFAEGLLDADDPEPKRGTHYWLAPSAEAALEAAVEEGRPAGVFLEGQRVLQLRPGTDADPFAVLGRPDLAGAVAWVIEWGGAGELLVGLGAQADFITATRLKNAFTEVGVLCEDRRVGEVVDRARLTAIERARQSIDDGVPT